MISSFSTADLRAAPGTLGMTSLPREAYGPWTNAIRLDNRDAQIFVAPDCGRILRYGPSVTRADRAGEVENFLWENPKNHSNRVPVRAANSHALRSRASANANNFTTVETTGERGGETTGETGGEHGLPWPVSRWPEMFDPAAAGSHDLQIISRRAVAIESMLAMAFGFTLRREIALAPHGERVLLQSSLVPMPSTGRRKKPPAMPVWSPWSIAHVVTPTRLAIRINPANSLPGGHKGLASQAWETIRQVGDDVLLARCPGHPAKIGCDGDLVVAEIGAYLLIQRRMDDESSAGRDLPGEAVQISCVGNAGAADATTFDHATIEFTGRRGQSTPSLSVQWDFMPWNPTNTDSELAALVRSL